MTAVSPSLIRISVLASFLSMEGAPPYTTRRLGWLLETLTESTMDLSADTCGSTSSRSEASTKVQVAAAPLRDPKRKPMAPPPPDKPVVPVEADPAGTPPSTAPPTLAELGNMRPV